MNMYKELMGLIDEVYPETIEIRGWQNIYIARGDNTYITVFLPGVRLSVDEAVVYPSVSSFNISIYTSVGWVDKTISNFQSMQESTGIKFIATASGYGECGPCIIQDTFTVSR